jgi:hypothetical protein
LNLKGILVLTKKALFIQTPGLADRKATKEAKAF